MLSHTKSVQELIDYALLKLWYANHWETMDDMPENIKKEQAAGFRTQAYGIVDFIQSEILSPDSQIEYKGIMIASNLLPYFQEREKYYAHPKG